jgi:NAD(P)-dependent dehydrogenase (short-subunit alcohol dehydrogenase family)
MPTPSSMKGKAALVTGAAAGLGRATAIALARLGADIAIVDIDAKGLEETAGQIRALDAKALVHASDLAARDNCLGCVDAAVRAFGRLDALVNVAGVMIPAHTPELSQAAWEKTLAVNLSAPFYLFQQAVPHLLEANGAVVNVTSCAAFQGQSYLAAYGSTKAALNYLTKSLAMEFMHKPIRINAVAPGGMMTALAMGMTTLKDPDTTLTSRLVPLRGMVEIEDVAEMVAFLATDAARGYHGAVINIDKGITAG